VQVADNLPLHINLDFVLLHQTPAYSADPQPSLEQPDSKFAMHLDAARTSHFNGLLQEAGPGG
jgi:hypothetical protein